MTQPGLKIAPPRRSVLFIFLVVGLGLVLNGLVVILIPHPQPDGPATDPLSPTPGVGGWMPLVAGFLCLAGAGWMLNRHRSVARIAELVHAELPVDGTDPDSRERLLSALVDRAVRLKSALRPFPEAMVGIDLRIGETDRLDVTLVDANALSCRLVLDDARHAREIERQQECLVHDDEILLDFTGIDAFRTFVDTLTRDILTLPPDFELQGDVRVSRRPTST